MKDGFVQPNPHCSLLKLALTNRFVLLSTDFSCCVIFGEVNFGWCLAFGSHEGVRMEAINDEVIEGHPLYGKGLAAHRSFLIENSRWIEALKRTHSVHPQYSEARWRGMEHYFYISKIGWSKSCPSTRLRFVSSIPLTKLLALEFRK